MVERRQATFASDVSNLGSGWDMAQSISLTAFPRLLAAALVNSLLERGNLSLSKYTIRVAKWSHISAKSPLGTLAIMSLVGASPITRFSRGACESAAISKSSRHRAAAVIVSWRDSGIVRLSSRSRSAGSSGHCCEAQQSAARILSSPSPLINDARSCRLRPREVLKLGVGEDVRARFNVGGPPGSGPIDLNGEVRAPEDDRLRLSAGVSSTSSGLGDRTEA